MNGVQSLLNWFRSHRSLLHPQINRLIDGTVDVTRRAVVAPLKSMKFNLKQHEVPPSPVVLPAVRRVLVAPLNFAGQGYAWAQAINANIENTAAVNLSITRPGDFQFASDVSVPDGVQKYHKAWQVRESEYVSKWFTHVLIESGSPIFGRLFGNDPRRELAYFTSNGVHAAYVCHGSDIRSPEKHQATTRFSPFSDPHAYNGRAQRRVDRNRRFLESSASPIFLSTPDLLNDYPHGIWLPVVVDIQHWSGAAGDFAQSRPGLLGNRPVVIHVPSRSNVKGSHLVKAPLEQLESDRVIDYRFVSGLPSAEMREVVLNADIVLDQFRLGSYGVAACEAMAAGKVVVGHVAPHVRQYVFQQTGMELPVVEADPETIARVLGDLALDPDRMRALGAAGRDFVTRVHSGSYSAEVLRQHWLH